MLKNLDNNLNFSKSIKDFNSSTNYTENSKLKNHSINRISCISEKNDITVRNNSVAKYSKIPFLNYNQNKIIDSGHTSLNRDKSVNLFETKVLSTKKNLARTRINDHIYDKNSPNVNKIILITKPSQSSL